MRFVAIVERPRFELPDSKWYYLVRCTTVGAGFIALTEDRALALWIAGQQPNREVIKVEVDNDND